MNIFEFLGLPAEHRPQGKAVQLVKNFHEVKDNKKSYPMWGQVKKDGVYGALVVNERLEASIFGRTGKQFTNCIELIERYCINLSPGVYIGEILAPGLSLEVLSGIINPNRTKGIGPELHKSWLDKQEIQFHDYLSLPEFIDGKSDLDYLSRLSFVQRTGLPTLSVTPLFTVDAVEAFAADCIEAGEEGAVFKDNSSPYVAGKKDYRAMKIVRAISYDLLCVGAEEGEGKYKGKVANLIFQWKEGDTLKAMLGKNYSHSDAENMLTAGESEEWYPIGKVFRVYGLQDSSKGKIRLPKVGEPRHDKTTPDF